MKSTHNYTKKEFYEHTHMIVYEKNISGTHTHTHTHVAVVCLWEGNGGTSIRGELALHGMPTCGT